MQPTGTDIFSQPDTQALNLARSIGLAEGGGKMLYTNTTGDAGTSKGAYQWQPGNFEAAAKTYGLDPTDFSPQNQDKVAYAQVKSMKDKNLTPAEIAATWNSGNPDNWQNHSGDTVINGQKIHYDTPGYVQKVQGYYKQIAGGQSQTPTDQTQNTQTPDQTQPESTLGKIGDFAKGLVSSPLTMLARPLQAGAELATSGTGNLFNQTNQTNSNTDQLNQIMKQYNTAKQSGDTATAQKLLQSALALSKSNSTALNAPGGLNEAINKSQTADTNVNNVNLGGLIAPTPQNNADLGKDVGRGLQTVALGLNPTLGGAVFGAGNSLEQGNDLLSAQTAFQTVLGAGAGKILDLVGKPLLDATDYD